MRRREHTSASQLSTYASCPRKYAFRYVEGAEGEFTSVGLVVGSTFHGAVGWWFEERIAGKKPTIEEALEIAPADFAAMTEREVRWGRWTPGDLLDHSRRLIRHFLEQHGDLPVKAVEAQFRLDIYDPDTGEVMPRPLIGYFDLVLGDRRLVELKTSRSDYQPMHVASSLQFACYSRAIGVLEVADVLDLLVTIKNKNPRIQHVRIKPTAAVQRWFLKSASDIERAIAAGHFPPSPGRMCGGCEYQRRCLGEVLDAEAA